MNIVETKREVWELPIGENVSIKTTIHENPLGLHHSDLFSLGFRYNNSKRSFMFVSKVLGKHSPINPSLLCNMTKKLANLYFSERESGGKVLIIGFAEAATAMAQCFSDAVDGDVSYVHSTRETPKGIEPIFEFKEAHSHAPCHNFYLTNENLIKEAAEIVLVDDEITSGKTALGVIKKINSLYPGKDFGMATFLDWREERDKEAFNELRRDGVKIECKSLLHGKIELDDVQIPLNKPFPIYRPVDGYKSNNWNFYNLGFSKLDRAVTPYIEKSGRFGLSSLDREDLKEIIKNGSLSISKWLPQGKSLFLGTGELLYIPLKIAQGMGENVMFQSVTRTPNLPLIEKNYDIRSIDIFPSPLDPDRSEFLYNIDAGIYDNVVLFLERTWDLERVNPILSVIESKGFKSCNMVVLCD